MRRGTKAGSVAVRRMRGTYRADRHAGLVDVEVPPGVPRRPDWLSDDAAAIWDEMVEHLAGSRLAAEPDALLLAQLCSLHAACIAAWSAGCTPPISALAELRRLSETFGLAGPRSRLVKMSAPQETNPFSQNGKRPGVS